MVRPVLLLPIVAVAGAAIATAALDRSGPPLETATLTHADSSGSPPCPWRHPGPDMAELFPGADAYGTDVLVLSRLRRQILARLGPGGTIDSNVLYAYRVSRRGRACGTVLASRAAGEYGAIEIVVGLDLRRRIMGVHIQRQREPEAVGRYLSSPAFLGAYRDKDAGTVATGGLDVPAPPRAARQSAVAVEAAIRQLLIEFDVAEALGAGHIREDSH